MNEANQKDRILNIDENIVDDELSRLLLKTKIDLMDSVTDSI